MESSKILELVKQDTRYMPLTPKHYQNGLNEKSQLKHWESAYLKWEKENKVARQNNGKLWKEYKYTKVAETIE